MKYLSIRLMTDSPLSIRADHASEGANGIRYIPGTSFVGGLAGLYRLFYDGKAEIDDFARLFLSERVFYPNLYPAVFKDSGLQQRNVPVYPLPKTAQSCKRHKGFRFPDDEDNDAHGVRDTLVDWALFKLISSGEQRLEKIQPLDILRCGKDCCCGEAMDNFDGYYRRNDNVPNQMIGAQVDSYIRLQTRTGIHRESGTVQEGILYNRQVFEEGMQFWGQARFPDNEQLITPFETFINKIGPSGMLRLGTGRTRGMGKVTLAVERTPEKLVSFDTFSERLAAFNKALHQRANEFGLGRLPYGYFFALTLHSPLILCDDLLRYRSSIDTGTLQNLLNYAIPGIKRLYYAASIRHVTGWQELWGTPRTSEYAIETGSVFLFACPSSPDDTLLRALFTLEEHGAGKRRAEGFGRICVSDQFHQQVHQEAKVS